MKRIIQISTLALLVILSTGCKKSYTVTVYSNNTEWGTVTGSGSYKDGETVITVDDTGALEYAVMGLMRGKPVRPGEV